MDGRTADIVHLPGRGGATVPVHPSVLGSAVAPFTDVREYAFVREAGGLHVDVVLAPAAPADLAGRLGRAIRAAIASTGAVPPPVTVAPVPALRREPGGKVRLVRSAGPVPTAVSR